MYLPLETPSWAQDELSDHSQTKETFPWEIGTDGVVMTFTWAEILAQIPGVSDLDPELELASQVSLDNWLWYVERLCHHGGKKIV